MESTPVLPVPCPAPFTTVIEATVPYIVATDFNASQLTNHQEALGFTGADKIYLHTFVWKPNSCCCIITKADLVVKMKSILGGASATSSDAGNDLIGIVGFGGVGLVPSTRVYDGIATPFPAGTTVTKTFSISGSALNKLNTEHTLSIVVEDDTTVLSATLTVSGCCLKKD